MNESKRNEWNYKKGMTVQRRNESKRKEEKN